MLHKAVNKNYGISFKPYYKWIIFNIFMGAFVVTFTVTVLNLIING